MRPTNKALIGIFLAVLSLQLSIAQTSPEPCGEPNYVVEGTFTNSSSTAPILEAYALDGITVKVGDKGELSKYFEESLFGGIINGWIVIGSVEVTAINSETRHITFKVLEKKSVVTVNGQAQSHFIKGKIIRFSQISYNTPTVQKLYYENGDLKNEGTVICGKKTGEWKYYHANGKIEEIGTYNSEGKEEGVWKYYYENGNLKQEIPYKAGVRDGIVKYYNQSGICEKQVTYTMDRVTGPYSLYYPSGKLKMEGNHVNDEDDGYFRNYNEAGIITSEGTYSKMKKNGLWKFYEEDGRIISEITYTNDEITGAYKLYYPDGKLKAEGSYFKEKPEGHEKLYYPSGQIQSECTYYRSYKNGDFTTWYENGQIKEQGLYNNNGRLEGVFRSYYENGSPKEEGSYTFGEKKGKWFEWNEKGKKKTVKYK